MVCVLGRPHRVTHHSRRVVIIIIDIINLCVLIILVRRALSLSPTMDIILKILSSIIFVSLSLGTANSATKVINFMLITSGGGQYNSSGVEPAVDLAVELVNKNEVIPGYQLNVASRGNSSVSLCQ